MIQKHDWADFIRVVLVRTSHPGNIGAAARAMKTMGLKNLSLVSPKHFPHQDALARATHASDILDNAKVFETLPEALSDTILVYGLSARHRDLASQFMFLEDAAKETIEQHNQGAIAWVFGNETTGLTNDELKLCHRQVTIPTESLCSSLNLGSAVQVAAYAMYMAKNRVNGDLPKIAQESLTSFKEYEGFYAHLERVLWKTKFLESGNDERMMRRLRRLFGRMIMEKRETVILRGILTSIEQTIDRNPFKK